MSGTARGAANESVMEAFVKLLVAEPEHCDRDELAVIVRRSLRVRGWLDSIDANVAARTARLAAEGRAEAPADLLSGGGRRGQREADAAARRGTLCEQMPAVGDALADGTVSAGHVDALANAARGLDDTGKQRLADCEEALVNAAASMTPEEFDRECKDLARSLSGDDGLSRQERLRRQRNVRRWVDRHTGMHKTLLTLDPLADSEVWTAITAAVNRARAAKQDDGLTFDQLQADTVVELITRPNGGDGGGEAVPEVSVLIDLDTLRNGVHDGTVAETSAGERLPVATIRRLCCDADIVPVVLGGDGEVLDVGRSRRLATRAQRRALRAMHATCAHPSCQVAFDDCRIHHVSFWEHGGPSDLVNLVPICERHHHVLHEGGWTFELFADRRTVWRRPDGTVWHDDTSIDRTRHDVPARPMPAASRSNGGEPGERTFDSDVDQLVFELNEALAAATNRAPP
ncbi:MAG: DUF222 domain-containing protein [Acidimicrobiales bacterium]